MMRYKSVTGIGRVHGIMVRCGIERMAWWSYVKDHFREDGMVVRYEHWECYDGAFWSFIWYQIKVNVCYYKTSEMSGKIWWWLYSFVDIVGKYDEIALYEILLRIKIWS